MVRDHASTDPAATNDVTLRLLLAYLAVTALPILRGATASGSAAVVACLHLSTLAGVFCVRRFANPRAAIVTWLPLIVLPGLYVEVPSVITGLGTTFHDSLVASWEFRLFGGQPAQSMAAVLPSRVVSELLHLGYLAYYPLIYVPPLILFARGRREELSQTVLAIAAVWLACLVAFVVFPVAGPRYVWSQPAGIPEGPIRSIARWLLERGSARGTAFPSSHVAISVVQSLAALRFQRRVGVAAAFITTMLAVGAVYGGFHYAIDIVAGAALGGLVFGALFSKRVLALVSSRWAHASMTSAESTPGPE
jgi:membrane-associated phospholipid phosphatase